MGAYTAKTGVTSLFRHNRPSCPGPGSTSIHDVHGKRSAMADEISLQWSSHRSIVRIAGELDLVTAPLLRALLKSADDDLTHEFVVTLPGITFMDCAGLAPLLEAHAELGGRLRLRDLPRAVSNNRYQSSRLRLTSIDRAQAARRSGREVPITEDMVQQACRELEKRLVKPGK